MVDFFERALLLVSLKWSVYAPKLKNNLKGLQFIDFYKVDEVHTTYLKYHDVIQ